MKTKNKKTRKKTVTKPLYSLRGILGKYFAIWLAGIIIAILAISYQIVRANTDDGLQLTTPIGSVAREKQLDAIELQQQTADDQTYDQQQTMNAQGDETGLEQLGEAIDDATN